MSARMRPRAVIFDLFHTLVDVNGAPGFSSAQILGVDPLVWNRTIFHHAAHHALGSVIDPIDSFRRIVRSIDPAIPEATILRAAAARPERFRWAMRNVRPEILGGVARLRRMGIRLALLSNAGWDEIGAWVESPLAPHFDAALFSCHEGLMKPDPEFYLMAARRLGVEPADCLFAGDGGSDEHEGARTAGMRTALLLGLLEEALPEVAAARSRATDWVLQSVADLADVVEALQPATEPAGDVEMPRRD